MAACYLVAKWLDYRRAVREMAASEERFRKEYEASEERFRKECEASEARLQYELEALDKRSAERNETFQKLLETSQASYEAALQACGSIFGTASGALQDQGGERVPGRGEDVSETMFLCVCVDEINARDKEKLILGLQIKGGEGCFRAALALNPEDYTDFNQALDMVWDSARFADKYFWARVAFVRCQDRIIAATVTAVASEEAELTKDR